MTKTKLVLIEGLPGFGKTTIASLVQEILTGMNVGSRLFLEWDLEHPADYERVACLSNKEFAQERRWKTKYSTG